jgi:hypothetical protein
MITWKFENTPITFKSKEENLDRDISKMRKANFIDPLTQIIILNGTVNKPIFTDAASIDGSTSVIPQSTIPMVSKKTKSAQPKTTELPSMSSNVDNVSAESNPMESPDPSGNINLTSNFDASEPDGQDTH